VQWCTNEESHMHKPTLLAFALTACLATATASAAEPADTLTPEEALKRLPAYTDDQPRRLLRFLEAQVQHAAGDADRAPAMADRLAAVLEDPKATPEAKRFVCRWLPLVAGDAQVPVLARLLAKEETFEIARQALAAIPGEASAMVLRKALSRAGGSRCVALVGALAARRDAKAVESLTGHLLLSSDSQVVFAAAAALGEIGTIEAADALARVPKDAAGEFADRLRDARLRCARRLAAAREPKRAVAIYREIFDADLPARWRIAAMMGLVDYCGQAGWGAITTALDDRDPTVRAAAIQAARRLTSRHVTEELVRRLPDLSVRDQVLLLDVLAARADAAARPGVLKLAGAKDEQIRVAAVRALGALGAAEDVPRLLDLAATGKGVVQGAAREALARLNAEGTEKPILDAAAKANLPQRNAALAAIADRRMADAGTVLLEGVEAPFPCVRASAMDALAVVGTPGQYAAVLKGLAEAEDAGVIKAGHAAAVAVGKRVAKAEARLAPIRKALGEASPPGKARLLAVLPALGDGGGLALLEPYLAADAAAVRDAAVRALVAWPDAAAADLVLAVAKESENRTHRVLAFRAAMRLMKETSDAAARQRMMERVRPLAATPDAKKMLLAALAEVAEPWSLAAAEAFVDDPQVKAEAEAAVKKIQAAQKRRPRRTAAAPVPGADPKALAARRKELDKAAPDGFHLACYMDCGPQTTAGEKDGPRLRVASGAPYFWGGSDSGAPVRYGTIVFTGQEVAIEAAGLDPQRAYRLGFSWWDYDHNTRAQSVWAAPAGRRAVRLLARTDLPSGARGEKPGEKVLDVPRSVTAAKQVRLAFRNESQPNAVVSEVWLLESDATSDPPKAAAEAPDPSAGAIAVDRSPRKADARILLVTGVDHPGHPWRKTTPILRQAIERDERLAVDVVTDPAWLETGDLAPYKAVVHHWMDWQVPPPGEAARKNLEKFVRGGGGLVLVHFACGAWQDWPGFLRIAGRVWDPKLRGHDPRGPFTVDVVDADHPITRGLPKAFETVDELYTCLAGETPVHLLAKATSKVDHKDYPMAFVLTCGKGRVFHSVLGHDTKALAPEAVRALYRRGAAWAAGLEPKP